MFSLGGVRLWVKPKEAIERVAGTGMGAHEAAPVHPSLVFHDLVKRLGNLVPASPKDVTVMQRRLIRAGFRNPNALKVLYGAKAILAVLLPVVMTVAVFNSSAQQSNKVMAILVAVAAGFFGPNEYVRMAAKRRQKQIQRGLANALDLMVVCVESGLGLDQAIMQVAKELEHAHPEISEEFAIVNLELKAGKRRAEALRNLADRTGGRGSQEAGGGADSGRPLRDRRGPESARALRLYARASAPDRRGESRQAGRKAGISDFFLYSAVFVRGNGWADGYEDHAGAAPDDEQHWMTN